MAHKVLIVAYYWPPAGGPGVQRWLKFVKYLPDFGIEPIVYVPENPSYPIVDESLLDDISDKVTVIKGPIREPYGVASALSRKQTKTISAGILPKEGKQSLLQKAMLYIRGNYFIPDARVGWVKPSVTFLKAYIAENDIKMMVTTGPPHSLHLIGRDLKAALPDLKWFADFRDPWTTIGYHDKLRMTAKTKATHKQLEKEILNTADQIIVTSPSTKSEFEAITTQNITVITNGFDREIAAPETSALEDNSFVLGHFGSLLSERNPNVLWEVLSELINENLAFANAFQLKFAGKISQEIIDSLEKHNLNNHFKILGYLPYNQLLEIYNKVDVLLLVEIDSEITKAIIPGKIFEYLAARKPILAIGPKDGDVSQIITETNSGAYFTYQDRVAIKTHILHAFTHRNEVMNSDSKAISQYHRKGLTEQLAVLFKANL